MMAVNDANVSDEACRHSAVRAVVFLSKHSRIVGGVLIT